MKKTVLLIIFLIVSRGYSQSDRLWATVEKNYAGSISKNAKRDNFPQDFKLF